jgi:hypothetical protein
MAAGSAAMRGQVRAASWHKGEAQLARHGVGHTDQPTAPLPWRCPRRSAGSWERGQLIARGRGGWCPSMRRRRRPGPAQLTTLVIE